MKTIQWRQRIAGLMAIAFVAGAPSWAAADPTVLAFDFGGLAGSFAPTGGDSGLFTAAATSDLDGDGAAYEGDFTSGSARRNVDPEGTAWLFWDPDGVFGSYGLADYMLEMNVTNIDTANNTADANGTFVLTDVDGDYIEAQVSGSWTLTNSQAVFSGSMYDIIFSDPNGAFNGNFGSFSTDFSQHEPLFGVTTNITGVEGGLFENQFEQHLSTAATQIVPAPGAVLLGALGLGMVGFVRRRFM